MKNDKPAEIEKQFNLLIKKIDTNDLRDMLAILYSEPELVLNNPDFDNLSQEEKEGYQKQRAKMTYFEQERLEDLRNKLINEFRTLESIAVPDPLLGEAPNEIKPALKEATYTYPKASLLTALIKSTLNLRETGKELPDELTIKQIELFTSDHSENDYQIVINGDYLHPLKVNKQIKIWNMFFDLVNNGYLDRNEATQDLYDYLNYNPNNKVVTNAKYPNQRLVNLESNGFRPNFK